jgi:hypothetical protein
MSVRKNQTFRQRAQLSIWYWYSRVTYPITKLYPCDCCFEYYERSHWTKMLGEEATFERLQLGALCERCRWNARTWRNL